MKKLFLFPLLFLFLFPVLTTFNAYAQTAGSWNARVGATVIRPVVASEAMSAPSLPDSRADVSQASNLSGGVTYMWSDTLALDVPIAPPFTHTLYGAGSGLSGVGQVGTVDVLPATLFVQYRFGEANDRARAYVGAGPTYAYFSNPKGSRTLTATTGGTPSNPTTFTVDSKLVPSFQMGFILADNGPYTFDFMIAKTYLSTTTTFSTGQTLKVNLDPVVFSVGVGYGF